MPVAWIEGAHAGLAGAFARRLHGRAGTIFRAVGEATCRDFAEAALAALRHDLAAGQREAVRRAIDALVGELTPRGLSFADLRFYAQSLRTLVLAALDEAPGVEPGIRRRVEEWCYEVLLVGTMRFVVHHEDASQERAARHEVQHLEAQLVEVRAAFEEKARLLERIKQASTPIAPVVEGILVVPLVGVFDRFRAEALTEKLLQEVARAQAQVVILDISGVPVFDEEASRLVIRLTRAVRLLGTELLLVGVSSAIARAIVELRLDLRGLRTLGTLQDGLAYALARRSLAIVPTPPEEPPKG